MNRWVELARTSLTLCAKCVAAIDAVAPDREPKEGLLQEIRQEATKMDEKGLPLPVDKEKEKKEDDDYNNHNDNHSRTNNWSTKTKDEETVLQEISQKVQEICDKMRLLVA